MSQATFLAKPGSIALRKLESLQYSAVTSKTPD
jgi:hypothetical protein